MNQHKHKFTLQIIALAEAAANVLLSIDASSEIIIETPADESNLQSPPSPKRTTPISPHHLPSLLQTIETKHGLQ
jgi:hypothetical protein